MAEEHLEDEAHQDEELPEAVVVLEVLELVAVVPQEEDHEGDQVALEDEEVLEAEAIETCVFIHLHLSCMDWRSNDTQGLLSIA